MSTRVFTDASGFLEREASCVKMIVVGTFTTRGDAEVAQAALAAAGVQSVLESDDAGGAYPFDLSGGARLLVDEADAQFAAAVLSPTDTEGST